MSPAGRQRLVGHMVGGRDCRNENAGSGVIRCSVDTSLVGPDTRLPSEFRVSRGAGVGGRALVPERVGYWDAPPMALI